MIDLPRFVNETVFKNYLHEALYVFMKMDIEGSEFSLLRELLTSGTFCHLHSVGAEYHNR